MAPIASQSKSIKCRTCARVLAAVSHSGLLPIDSSMISECSMCNQFTTLYNTMVAADKAYMPLLARGDKHRGKQTAIAEVNQTHMALDNWLMAVEDFSADEQNNASKEKPEEQQYDTKRSRSYSPTSQGIEVQENDQTQSKVHVATFALRPSPKRSHTASSPTCLHAPKRLKFSDSVEFRDQYRNYLELSRSHKNYVPGRYAPPEGGYLDTSGADMSALKFTGVRRVKGGWVEIVPRKKGNKNTKAVNVNENENENEKKEM